jgi:hypothetical protein
MLSFRVSRPRNFGFWVTDYNRFSDCTWDALKPEGRVVIEDKSPAKNLDGGLYLSVQCLVGA